MTDSVSVADSIITISSFSIMDSASTTDTISASAAFSRTIADSATSDDSIRTVFPRSMTDSVSTNDHPSTETIQGPNEPENPPLQPSPHKKGTGATGVGLSAGPSSSGPGGGNSEPKADDSSEELIEEVEDDIKQIIREEDVINEVPEQETPTKPDEISKEEEKFDLAEFIQQVKNIHMAMIIASILVVVTIFLVRARGILFG